ncbi:hypothetical protein [Faecalibacter sp. LW9]
MALIITFESNKSTVFGGAI